MVDIVSAAFAELSASALAAGNRLSTPEFRRAPHGTPGARMLAPCTRMSRVKADQSARYGPDLVVFWPNSTRHRSRPAQSDDLSRPPASSRSVAQGPNEVVDKTSGRALPDNVNPAKRGSPVCGVRTFAPTAAGIGRQRSVRRVRSNVAPRVIAAPEPLQRQLWYRFSWTRRR